MCDLKIKPGWDFFYIIERGTENYLCTDGVVRNWCKEGKLALSHHRFATKELAKQALENYNNKGEVMKTISIKDENGKEYRFEKPVGKGSDVQLLKIVRDRIVGCYTSCGILVPSSWNFKGEQTYEFREVNLIPYDPFKELKRVYSEGAIIEYKGDYPWRQSIPNWYDKYDYRIKGNISIERWDKHKEVIKEFWNGVEVECFSLHDTSGWYNCTNGPIWSTDLDYRVAELKETIMSIRELEVKYNLTNLKIKGE